MVIAIIIDCLIQRVFKKIFIHSNLFHSINMSISVYVCTLCKSKEFETYNPNSAKRPYSLS